MSDIFSEGIGGETELTPSAEAPVEVQEPTVSSTTDAAPEATAETQVEAVQEAPATPEEAKPSEDDIAALEKEVETALADERTPKWFKNVVENVYKPKMATLTEQLGSYEPLQQFGTAEEIAQKLEHSQVETVRSNPQTGMPELSTEPFVKRTYEKDPKVAYQLLNDLSNLPSPYTQGWTVLQEMYKQTGIDPTRLEDIKTFAANGYQLQASQYPAPEADDLALIPRELQSTFAQLSPERRDSLMADGEAVRNANLEDARAAMDAKASAATQRQVAEQREAQEKTQQEQQFKNTVETKGFEHFIRSSETVFTSFVDSLAKQANMTKMDSLMIANTVLNSFEPTLQGRQSLETLKAEGIPVDPLVQTTIAQLQENSRHIAYYEAIGDESNKAAAVAKQVELQERIVAKSNKIIAALAQKRAKGLAAPIQTQNAQLAANNNSRYAVAGTGTQVGSNGQANYDFSDESYAEDLRASGFGRR